MIETDRLTKRYGHLLAVDELSFTVSQGEVLGFLGPNGAGKSTTMKMLSGFLSPTSGSARICGFDVESRPVEAKRQRELHRGLGTNYLVPDYTEPALTRLLRPEEE